MRGAVLASSMFATNDLVTRYQQTLPPGHGGTAFAVSPSTGGSLTPVMPGFGPLGYSGSGSSNGSSGLSTGSVGPSSGSLPSSAGSVSTGGSFIGDIVSPTSVKGVLSTARPAISQVKSVRPVGTV